MSKKPPFGAPASGKVFTSKTTRFPSGDHESAPTKPGTSIASFLASEPSGWTSQASPSDTYAIAPLTTAGPFPATVRCPFEPPNMRATAPIPTAAATKATAIASARERAGVAGGGGGSRCSMSRQRSGVLVRENDRNRSSRSVIVVLQELAQPASPSHHVHADGRLGRADDPCDLLGGVAGRVVQDHRGPLLVGQLRERDDEVAGRLLHLVGLDRLGHRTLPPLLQFAARDPERGPPDPPLRILDGVAAPQDLRERLGHRIARHLRVAREGQERPPQPVASLPVQALDLLGARRARRRTFHSRSHKEEDRSKRERGSRGTGASPCRCGAAPPGGSGGRGGTGPGPPRSP